MGLLTEKDPVCDDWIRYADELARETKAWNEINKMIPASSWNAEQRTTIEEAGVAMQNAADRFATILGTAKQVILQELIAQAIVHWRAYVAKIPNYQESDASLAGVATNFTGAVTFMCTAVPIVQVVESTPRQATRVGQQPSELERFLITGDRACDGFLELVDRQNSVLSGWERVDPALSADEWTPEVRQINMAAINVLSRDAEQARKLASHASDPILTDLLFVYSVYLDAYTSKLTSYTPDDNQIWRVSTYIGGGVAAACGAT